MMTDQGKAFGTVPLFNPAEGTLVRAPQGDGPGWWAGAPCATFDPISNSFYLVYRYRQPRELGRGIECRVAASDNGITFSDIWALPKSNLNAISLERSALLHGFDGRWRLYIGHVAPEDRRWRISMMEADEPDQFDLATLTPLITGDMVGADGVSNPNAFVIGRMVYLLYTYAERQQSGVPEEQRHAGGDVFSTGLTRARTGAAISGDGRTFVPVGDVTPGGTPLGSSPCAGPECWDGYCCRVGALLPLDGGGWLAFYDGGASVADNYEEKTGLATTFDLRTYHTLTPTAPALRSLHGSGCLRYVDVLPVGHELFYYYEVAREDGAHELHVQVVERT